MRSSNVIRRTMTASTSAKIELLEKVTTDKNTETEGTTEVIKKIRQL